MRGLFASRLNVELADFAAVLCAGRESAGSLHYLNISYRITPCLVIITISQDCIIADQRCIYLMSSPLIKQPNRTKSEQFEHKCGQCLLSLQQYKLRSNLINGGLSKQQYKKYYSYLDNKPKKRLQFVHQKLQDLVRTFERNQSYLYALELRAVNNMLKIWRKRVGLEDRVPAMAYNKFEKEENDLLEFIVCEDYEKLQQVERIIGKVKETDHEVGPNLEKKSSNESKNTCFFSRSFKIMSKAQIQYSAMYQMFEQSICKMQAQLSSQMEKLNNFYIKWQNLGSSMIYEIKSDRQVFIDKTIEERKNKNYNVLEVDQEEIMQVIDVMPASSKIRQYYVDKLDDIRTRSTKFMGVDTNKTTNKSKKGNLKASSYNISKMSWFETEAEDFRDIAYQREIFELKQTDESFFKYTYEQYQKIALEPFLEQKNNLKVLSGQMSMNAPFSEAQPKPGFTCWYDRMGNKGIFNLADFPCNLVQRKLQYEYDRQVQMETMDDKRKKEYNLKENKLQLAEGQGNTNIGYRYLDTNKELQQLRDCFNSKYNADFLPELKDFRDIEKFRRANLDADFMSSEEEPEKKQLPNKRAKQDSEDDSMEQSVNRQKQSAVRVEQSKEKELQRAQAKKQEESKGLKPGSVSSEFIKALNSKSSPDTSTARIDIDNLFPWIKTVKKEKQVLQLFVQSFLPSYEKSLVKKLKERKVTRYEEQIIESIQFIYLPSFEEADIREALRNRYSSKQDKENINKIYLVNRIFYAKVQPIFFSNRRKMVKIVLYLTTHMHNFEQLKSNLQKAFSEFGSCAFHINVDLVDRKYTNEERLYSIVGHLMKDVKGERFNLDLSKIVQAEIKETETSLEESVKLVLSEGRRVFTGYEKLCAELKKIEK